MSILALDPKRQGCFATPKQIAVLKALVKRNPDGSYLDVYQLLESCAPNTVRGSMLCTIRHLYAHGLVREDDKVLRRGRMIRTYAATQLGITFIRPSQVSTTP